MEHGSEVRSSVSDANCYHLKILSLTAKNDQLDNSYL